MVPSHAVGFLHMPTFTGGTALRVEAVSARGHRASLLRATASGGLDAQEQLFGEDFTRRSMLISSLFVAVSLITGGGASGAQAEEVASIDGVLIDSTMPTEAVLKTLRASNGLRSVLNLLPYAEAKANELGELWRREEYVVKELGMNYAQIDVPQKGPYSKELKLKVREQVAALPKPLLVHCRGGDRCQNIVLDSDTVDVIKQDCINKTPICYPGTVELPK